MKKLKQGIEKIIALNAIDITVFKQQRDICEKLGYNTQCSEYSSLINLAEKQNEMLLDLLNSTN